MSISRLMQMGAAGFVPPLDSDIMLYVPFNDADGSTTADGYVLSNGTHTLTSDVFTATGNAEISTDETNMTGTTTSAYSPAGQKNEGWVLDSTISSNIEPESSSDISIEFWYYASNAASGPYARLLYWSGFYHTGVGMEFFTSSSNYDRIIMRENLSDGSARRNILTDDLITNDWNHLYWGWKSGGPSYMAINGTVTEATGSYITDFSPSHELNLLRVGGGRNASLDGNYNSLKGYVQEFVVRNTVPYTSNFTPSTTPLR